jgi:CubicO group peptidase (beta-lactamase class C family)
MKKIFTFLIVMQMCYLAIEAQEVTDTLTFELNQQISSSRIPGLGVSIVSSNGILYSKGFGSRNVEENLPYDSLTLQPIASISKTFIGLALMKLVEENKIDLNTDINSILPFKVINPHFPESKITILHLATHTSSITDTYDSESAAYYLIDKEFDIDNLPKLERKDFKKYLKTKFLPYSEYLQAYLSVNGDEFDSKIFGKYSPGEQYSYSNIGATLAALIVEIIAEQSFESYTKEKIFDPLKMKNTSWQQKDKKFENSAALYFKNEIEVPEYINLFFPSSSLYSNYMDMAKYMFEIVNGYNGKGILLKPSSYKILLDNQIVEEKNGHTHGIFWQVNSGGTNIGHTGSNFGVTCRLVFNPELDRAIFMMINISLEGDDELKNSQFQILRILSEYSKKME